MEKRGDRRTGEKRRRETTPPRRESHPSDEAKQQEEGNSKPKARPKMHSDEVSTDGVPPQQPHRAFDDATPNEPPSEPPNPHVTLLLTLLAATEGPNLGNRNAGVPPEDPRQNQQQGVADESTQPSPRDQSEAIRPNNPVSMPVLSSVPPTEALALGNRRVGVPLPYATATHLNSNLSAYPAMLGNPASVIQQQQPFGTSQSNVLNLSQSVLLQQAQLHMQQQLAGLAAQQSGIQSLPANVQLFTSLLAANPNATMPPTSLNHLGANASSITPLHALMTDPLRIAAHAAAMSAGMPLPSPQQQLLMNSLAALQLQGQVPTAATAGPYPRPDWVISPFIPPASLPLPLPQPAAALFMPQPQTSGSIGYQRTADLYMGVSDENILSDHQVLLRQQIEFFEARPEDIHYFTPGRRRGISVGQVGIRCKACALMLQPHERRKGCVYFPSTLRALYQAAQNMGTTHFLGNCKCISPQVQAQLQEYANSKAEAGYGGKKYWAKGAIKRGIYETETGLRFHNSDN